MLDSAQAEWQGLMINSINTYVESFDFHNNAQTVQHKEDKILILLWIPLFS